MKFKRHGRIPIVGKLSSSEILPLFLLCAILFAMELCRAGVQVVGEATWYFHFTES